MMNQPSKSPILDPKAKGGVVVFDNVTNEAMADDEYRRLEERATSLEQEHRRVFHHLRHSISRYFQVCWFGFRSAFGLLKTEPSPSRLGRSQLDTSRKELFEFRAAQRPQLDQADAKSPVDALRAKYTERIRQAQNWEAVRVLWREYLDEVARQRGPTS